MGYAQRFGPPMLPVQTLHTECNKAEVKSVYIFKFNGSLRYEDYKYLRDEIMQQIKEGLILISDGIEFIGREIEIGGSKVKIEFMSADQEVKPQCEL